VFLWIEPFAAARFEPADELLVTLADRIRVVALRGRLRLRIRVFAVERQRRFSTRWRAAERTRFFCLSDVRHRR